MDPSTFPTLDPELAPMLELLPDLTQGMEDIAAARDLMALMIPSGPVPGEEALAVEDVAHDGVALRVYRPASPEPDAGVLYLHGGGFCLGSVDSEHAGAVQLALALNVVVVSVDYRLAPEHPYPAGLDDCYAGLQYLSTLVDRIAVHGQSAGGGLAAATVLKARDLGGPRV